MDLPDADPRKLTRTLQQFKWINFIVSRYRTLLKRYILADMLSDPRQSYRLLDIGSGGCDIPLWLWRQCRRHNLDLHITCIDTDPRAVDYARDRYGDINELEIVQESVFNLNNLNGPFDYVFANHLLHHLTDDELLPALRNINAVTERLFVISDLRRSNLSYLLFTLTVGFLFHNSFIYADGKQSIKRGFLDRELRTVIRQVDVAPPIMIHRLFPGRIYLVCNKNDPQLDY